MIMIYFNTSCVKLSTVVRDKKRKKRYYTNPVQLYVSVLFKVV